jgi:hypothetical protein
VFEVGGFVIYASGCTVVKLCDSVLAVKGLGFGV